MQGTRFDIEGLPELNARLDKIATLVSGLIVRDALEAGGKIINDFCPLDRMAASDRSMKAEPTSFMARVFWESHAPACH
jgi:hypothetical protein